MSVHRVEDELLGIGEIAERAGVAASAVRFYERHGLVTSIRTSTNQRRFPAGAACRIQVARVAQRVGLSVREIAEILDPLPADPGPGDWAPVQERLVTEASTRIDRLTRTLDDLGGGGRLCELDPER